jgi:hypothetical protein
LNAYCVQLLREEPVPYGEKKRVQGVSGRAHPSKKR